MATIRSSPRSSRKVWASRPRLTRSKRTRPGGGPDQLRAVAVVVDRDGDAAVAHPGRRLVAAAGRERRGGQGEDEQEEGAAGHGRQRLFRMLCRLMRRPLLLLALPVVAAAAVACGSEEIEVAKNSPEYDGAEIFHAALRRLPLARRRRRPGLGR